jgi:REP element-mobilizing transposase RayT
MAKQSSFFKINKLTFGGSALSGHPREKRPLCTKRPIHLVLHSKMATGPLSMSRFAPQIAGLLEAHAQKCGVKIYNYANGGNHLHLIVKIASHALFAKFLRAVTGLIARLVLTAEKASAKLKGAEKFWSARPFTRVAAWGRAYEQLRSYVTLNQLEALGFVKHQPRDHKRRKLWSVKVEPFTMT